MTDRTFQQYAQGYGSVPSQVVFQIDGNTVFSGSILTLDEPLPSLPNPEFAEPALAWTWQNPADFQGTQQISISVTGSPVLLGQTWANDPYISNNNPYGNVYNIVYAKEIDGVTYFDPFTNEAIDGVAQAGPYRPENPGQWWWMIPAGSTFTATLNISATVPPPSP